MSVIGNNSGVSLGALTPLDQEKLRAAIKELDGAFTRQAAERELIKEIVNKVSVETGVPKKSVRKMAKAYYNHDYDIEVAEQRDFEALYEHIMRKHP